MASSTPNDAIPKLLEQVRKRMFRGLTSPEHIEAAKHIMESLEQFLTPQDEGKTSR